MAPPAEIVLVTGASGNVGREVVRALLASPQRQTGSSGLAAAPPNSAIAVRAAGRGSGGPAVDGVEAVVLDFERPATFKPAVGNATRLFLLRPPAIASVKRTLNAFVDVAVTQGSVRHVVFVSVAGADRNTMVPHHAVEQHLLHHMPAHVAVTILRPGFFAQNLRDAYRDDIRLDDRLYVPAGDARVAWVDVRDIAAVAAQRLTTALPTGLRMPLVSTHVPDPEAAGTERLPWQEAFHLTGPAPPVTFAEVAACLSEALGRPIRYEPASMLGYLHHLKRTRGLPWAQAIVLLVLHVGLRYGQAEAVDGMLARCLGREATSIAEVIRYTVDEEPTLWRPLAPGPAP